MFCTCTKIDETVTGCATGVIVSSQLVGAELVAALVIQSTGAGQVRQKLSDSGRSSLVHAVVVMAPMNS